MAANPTDEYQNKVGLSYFWGRLKTIFATKTEVTEGLDDKVDKVDGKGLSTEDFTEAYKQKVDGIESGAEANDIDTISVNGTAQSIDKNKNVNITVPTKTSDLTNDSTFQTKNQVDQAIDDAVSHIEGITYNFDYDTFSELPSVGESGTIYFIPDISSFEESTDTEFISGKKYFELISGEFQATTDTVMDPSKTYYTIKPGTNVYNEYVWAAVNNSYEQFGSASIDTSSLWSKSELVAITTAEIDQILAS